MTVAVAVVATLLGVVLALCVHGCVGRHGIGR